MGALSYFVNLEQSLYPLSSEDTEGRTATGAAQGRPCASDMGSVGCAFNRSQTQYIGMGGWVFITELSSFLLVAIIAIMCCALSV